MTRRLMAAAAVVGFGACSAAGSDVPLYFGRCDPVSWAAAHPAPPAPHVGLGRHRVEVIETRRVVPSPGLPGDLDVQTANNNLDVVRQGDRTYLAFRSAPSHFAGSETVLHVLESTDEVSWRSVGRFAIGRDLREPRWLALGDELFLYVTVLGDNAFDFKPEGVRVSVRQHDGTFGALEDAGLPGRVAWRTRVIGGRAFMTAYAGGETMYSLRGRSMSVELLTTADGRHWTALDPLRRVVSRGGGSESDFAFASDGSLFAVVRNEAGDADGFGSKLCRAEPGRLGDWKCVHDSRKYDSPNVFTRDGEIYVIARRNLDGDGRYDIASGPELVRLVRNQLAYITSAKRCSLWRLDPETRRLAFILDLPSRGDTCFASVLSGATPDTLVVYDYSSAIDGPDLPWSAGQRRPTYVYRHVLKFAPTTDG